MFGQKSTRDRDKDRDRDRDKNREIYIPLSEDKSSTASVKANDIIALKDEELQNEKKAKANKHKYGEYKNVLLKDEELQRLKKDYSNWEELITYLDEYIEMKGYKAKSHYLCIRKWVADAVKQKNKNKPKENVRENYKELNMTEEEYEEKMSNGGKKYD